MNIKKQTFNKHKENTHTNVTLTQDIELKTQRAYIHQDGNQQNREEVRTNITGTQVKQRQ